MAIDRFCFGTLAVGKRYRLHAQMLAEDLQKYSNNIPLIILTDKPSDFDRYPQIVAIEHTLKSVKGYHDKCFVFAKAFEQFDSCLFLDADVRIIAPIAEQITIDPGIIARSGSKLLKHVSQNPNSQFLIPVRQAAEQLKVNLEEVYFIHEFMFILTKQSDIEREFLDLWYTISLFFEKQNFYAGEGAIIGLAAAKTGLNLSFNSFQGITFFKDRIDRQKIKKGKLKLEDRKQYFDRHREIEFPQQSLLTKAINKLVRYISFLRRLSQLSVRIKNDSEYQKIFGNL